MKKTSKKVVINQKEQQFGTASDLLLEHEAFSKRLNQFQLDIRQFFDQNRRVSHQPE